LFREAYRTDRLCFFEIRVNEVLSGCVSGNLTATYRTECNLAKMEDGRMHLIPQEYDLEFDPKTVSLYFANLFNGNKLLGEISSKIHFECLRKEGG
jgi:hypothetical protein